MGGKSENGEWLDGGKWLGGWVVGIWGLCTPLARGLASISLTFAQRKMTTANPSPGRVAK